MTNEKYCGKNFYKSILVNMQKELHVVLFHRIYSLKNLMHKFCFLGKLYNYFTLGHCILRYDLVFESWKET